MNNWTKTIFRHETPQGGAWYSAAVAGKDGQGAKTYQYWPVDFPQGTEIPDRARVEFKDFFITYYIRKDGAIQYKFVVQDYIAAPPSYQQGQAPQGYQQPARQQGTQGGWNIPTTTPPGQSYTVSCGAQQPRGQGYTQQPVQQTTLPQHQGRPQELTNPNDFEALDEEIPF